MITKPDTIDEPYLDSTDATSIYPLSIMERRSDTPRKLGLKEAQEQWERFLPDLSHFENRVTISPNAECGTSGVIDQKEVEGKWAISVDGLVSAYWIAKETTGDTGIQERKCGGFTDVRIEGEEFRKFYGAKGTGFEWLKQRNPMGSEESYDAPARQRCIATEAQAEKNRRILDSRVPGFKNCGDT